MYPDIQYSSLINIYLAILAFLELSPLLLLTIVINVIIILKFVILLKLSQVFIIFK